MKRLYVSYNESNSEIAFSKIKEILANSFDEKNVIYSTCPRDAYVDFRNLSYTQLPGVVKMIKSINEPIFWWSLGNNYKWGPLRKGKNPDGFSGAILSDPANDFQLVNPPDHFDNPFENCPWGYLEKEHCPMLPVKPKGLLAMSRFELMGSEEFLQMLENCGGVFETRDVIYRKETIPGWKQIIPEDRQFIREDLLLYYGRYFSDGPLATAIIRDATSLKKTKNNFPEGEYIVNNAVAAAILQKYPRTGMLSPIYDLNGPFGQMFLWIKEILDPLKVEREPASTDTTPSNPAAKTPKKEEAFTIVAADKITSLSKTKGELLGFEQVATKLFCDGGKSFSGISVQTYCLAELDRLPEQARQAPLSSFMLARLCAEAQPELQYPATQNVDGGSIVLEFLVRNQAGEIIGVFQLQGGSYDIILLGNCREDVTPEMIAQDFALMLLREPDKVARCKTAIYDPEWHEAPGDYDPEPKRSSRNKFGWDGKKFLGGDNIWSYSSSGYARPDKYEDYLREVLADWKKDAAGGE